MPWLLVGAVAACSGQAGTPGAPTPAPGQVFVDAGPLDAEAGPPPALVQVAGTVTTPSDAGVSGAFVVVEVGGLDRANPASDGGGPTFAIDPFIRFGAVTDSMGHFSVSGVSAGMVGLHVLDPSYAETALLASTATLEGVTLNGLAVDGGGGPPPTMTGLSAPAFVSPSSEIQFAVNEAAGSADDPLSEDVFLIEPSAQWAGALIPPTPAVAGGAYPDGAYNRLALSPSQPGVYTYTAIAASLHHKKTSTPISIAVTVNATGTAPPPDAGPDGNVFPDSGLLGP